MCDLPHIMVHNCYYKGSHTTFFVCGGATFIGRPWVFPSPTHLTITLSSAAQNTSSFLSNGQLSTLSSTPLQASLLTRGSCMPQPFCPWNVRQKGRACGVPAPENPICLQATTSLPSVNPSLQTGAHAFEKNISRRPSPSTLGDPSDEIRRSAPSCNVSLPSALAQYTMESNACSAQAVSGVIQVHSSTSSSPPLHTRSFIAIGDPCAPQTFEPPYCPHGGSPM